MKKYLKQLALILILIGIGCAPYSKPQLLIDMTPPTTIRTDWEKYGAYYEIDEVFIEASYMAMYTPLTGASKSLSTRIIISKRIRILTKEGTAYATVPVDQHFGMIMTFNCRLFDENGNEKSLNLFELQEQYSKDGAIVFPNVTAGCVLEIYIEQSSSSPIVTYEHWFSRTIPVREARLTFSRPTSEFEYDFKEYGRLDVGRSQIAPTNSELTYTVWARKNVLPRSDIDYLDPYETTEPRVSIAMRYGFNQPVLTSWYDITKRYKHDFMEEPYTILQSDIKNLFDTLMQKESSVYKKADLALQWVQDNISLEKNASEDFNPDNVIRERKGTLGEVAVAMKDMLKYLGLNADIILTRPHSLGGFDESFITSRSLLFPLIKITIMGKPYCAYPYSRGGILGEYPQGFFNLKGVSLSKDEVIPIPEFISEKSHSDYVFSIDLTTDPPVHKLEINFEGYVAYRLRSSLLSSQKKDVREGFQKMLSVFGKSNALIKSKVLNLADRGKPIKVNLEFDNSDQIIERKGEKRLSLSHIFNNFFSSLDANRISAFSFKNKSTVHESLTVKENQGQKISVTIHCATIANTLFSVTCNYSENKDSYTFSRDIELFECDIPAVNLGPIYKDVMDLNKIKESYILF